MYSKSITILNLLAISLITGNASARFLATPISQDNKSPSSLQTRTDSNRPAAQFNSSWIDLVTHDGLAAQDPPASKIVKEGWNPKHSYQKGISQRSSYVFNPNATSNLVVYFGQTPLTSTTNLTNMCNDPNMDIVILGFVTVANGAMGYPNINFGSTCGSQQTAAQIAKAPGLLNCNKLAPQISYCQSIGKKVFLSIGGATSNVTLYSAAEATDFATKLWNLFGLGTGDDPNLRPFGAVSVDGFDLDNESKVGNYYDTFATTMRSLYATSTTKNHYLSGTAQCTFPDPSIPLSYIQQSDFLWVRFYNNLACNLGTTGFLPALKSISSTISGLGSNTKIYVGGLAYQTTGSGYVPPDNYAPLLVQAKALNLPNFGGAMLWDGTEAHITMNLAGNRTFAQVAKLAVS